MNARISATLRTPSGRPDTKTKNFTHMKMRSPTAAPCTTHHQRRCDRQRVAAESWYEINVIVDGCELTQLLEQAVAPQPTSANQGSTLVYCFRAFLLCMTLCE